MSIGEICNREVITIQRDETVLEAAKLMRQYHVGAVIVIDKLDGRTAPVGIITDRDLVVEVLATELDQTVITVGDIMAPEVFTLKESTEASAAQSIGPAARRICFAENRFRLDSLGEHRLPRR